MMRNPVRTVRCQIGGEFLTSDTSYRVLAFCGPQKCLADSRAPLGGLPGPGALGHLRRTLPADLLYWEMQEAHKAMEMLSKKIGKPLEKRGKRSLDYFAPETIGEGRWPGTIG
jgi:hypothetical protein